MTKIILRNQGLIFLPLLSLPLLATITLSCGGGGGGTLTQSDFCSKKAEKECAGVAVKCLATPSSCKAARVLACEAFATLQQTLPSIAARPFRPELADDCLNKTAAVYLKSPITPADRLPMEIACARVFSGKKKDTDTEKACSNDYECDASQICDVGFKLCAPKKMVGAGLGCNNPGEVCQAAEYCMTPLTAGSPRDCTPRPMVGLACEGAGKPCLDNLRCSNGICAEKVGLAGACGQDSDCLPDAPYCDQFNGSICVAGFIPGTGSPECVQAFGGKMPMTGGDTGGTGGAAGTQ